MLYIDLIEDSDDDALVVEVKLKKISYPYLLSRYHDAGEAVAGYQSLVRQHTASGSFPANRVVLLDLTLRNSHGFDFLHYMMSEPALNHLVTLIISSSDSKEAFRKSFRLGGCYFLKKPFCLEDFQAVLHTLIVTARLYPNLP